MEGLLEMFAEMYSSDLSQKVKRGIKESLVKGNYLGGRCLYGYKIVDKKAVIDEEPARAIRYLFSEYAAGKSKKQIVKELYDMGYRNYKGKPFTTNSFQCVLSNRKYLGEFIRHGIDSKCFPAIIDQETFDKAQEVLERHKRAPATQKAKVEYLLTGKAYCGHCGTGMAGVSGTSRTKDTHSYYACLKRWKKKACDKNHEKKSVLEKHIIGMTLEYVLNPETLEFAADGILKEYERSWTGQKIKEMERQVARLDSELDKCFDMIFDAATDEIKKRAETKAKDFEIQKKDLLKELSVLKAACRLKHTKDDILGYLNQFIVAREDETETDYHKRILDVFLNSVHIFDSKVFIYYNLIGREPVLRTEVIQDGEYIEDGGTVEENINQGGVLILSAPPCLTNHTPYASTRFNQAV